MGATHTVRMEEIDAKFALRQNVEHLVSEARCGKRGHWRLELRAQGSERGERSAQWRGYGGVEWRRRVEAAGTRVCAAAAWHGGAMAV